MVGASTGVALADGDTIRRDGFGATSCSDKTLSAVGDIQTFWAPTLVVSASPLQHRPLFEVVFGSHGPDLCCT